MRHLVPSLAALGVLLAAAPAAAQSSTTRIETRPFYGAVITLEEGVRVYRPLPATKNMIINPGGVTPLNLSIADVRVDEHRTNHNYNYDYHEGSGPTYGAGGVGGFYGGYGRPYGYGKRDDIQGGIPATGGFGGRGHKGGHR